MALSLLNWIKNFFIIVMFQKLILILFLVFNLISCGDPSVQYSESNRYEQGVEEGITVYSMALTFEDMLSGIIAFEVPYVNPKKIYVHLVAQDNKGFETSLVLEKLNNPGIFRIKMPKEAYDKVLIYAFSDEDNSGDYTLGDYFSRKNEILPPYNQYRNLSLEIRFVSKAFQ